MPEDKHQRITQAQFELWLNSPVTKTYFRCLAWSAEQFNELAGNGSLVDQSNNDRSMNQISDALGKSNGLKFARNANRILRQHEMLELAAEEKENQDGQ